jgi:hypothetical protein
MPTFPSPRQLAELDRFWADPQIRDYLSEPSEVVEDFEVPDLGGYSKDGARYYIDAHLAAAKPEFDGIPYATWRNALVGVDLKVNRCGHEPAEKAAIEVWGYGYPGAHEDVATPNEHRAATSIGLDWARYGAFLKPWIKRAASEKITRPPPDLDCRPYYDEPDHDDIRILRRLAELGVVDAAHPLVARVGGRLAADHKWYAPDPTRPGKHLQFTHDGSGETKRHLIKPPVPGAMLAPDGKHYVKQGGQHFEVRERPHPDARLAPDGNHYLPDPARPGKFVMVRHKAA